MAPAVRVPSPPRALVALAGGIVGAFSLPPWGWWPLAIVALALFAFALRDQPVRRRVGAGMAFGIGLFSIGLWWVTEFHAVGYVLLVVAETLFFAGAAAATTRAMAFPAAVVLAEAARGSVPFGGLPLGGLALSQAQGPLVASARIGGALLVLGVAAALGVALAALVRPVDTSARRAAAAMAAAAVAVAALGWAAPAGSRAAEHEQPLRAAIVQGGGPRGYRAVDTDASDVLDAHLAASESVSRGVDLVVWPENAIDVIDIEYDEAGAALAAIARRTGATVVAGVTQEAGDDGFENTAVVWTPKGDITDRYTKVRRVPFGEYVPMRAFLSNLVDLSVLPRDAVAGRGAGVVETPAGKLAVSISYEVFFADRARSGVAAGGELLLVPTNAASFKTSQVPTQEVAAAQLRAWETGRWVLQAAPTGYSAVIDERGHVHDRSVLSRREVLRATVPLRSGRTIYVRLGDLPVLLGAALLIALPSLRAPGRTLRRSRP